MKKSAEIPCILLIVLAVYVAFSSMMPTDREGTSIPETSFSTDRALGLVKRIARAPHAVGFPAHDSVRTFIVDALGNMGLETILQEGYTAGDRANFSKAVNILARVKGSGNGKALLLLSHYDSSPHSSPGASDAGSGVATVLEGLRAYLATNVTPLNDIMILFTDAEELGLNGADLFVNHHPWARDIGLVLNFEARGSGGPGYMLIETDQGNEALVREFIAAHPRYPVANSLAYSIYKMLPNDTDLTVFREDGDIDGFNFAFIDDHFDYHTALDTYERLNRATLAHQGSYLMPLLRYFSTADLGDLKSDADYVYFNVPFFGLVSYPYEWIWPMFFLALLGFAFLLFTGFRKGVLTAKEVGRGFFPLFIALLINGIVGFYSWALLKWLYPQYADMLQGFTYNGHEYITAFAFFATGVCFWSYLKFRRISTTNMLVAALAIWLLLCGAAAYFLPGAAFFIIPVFGLLASLMILIYQPAPNPYLLLFLALPALWILTPFIRMFPVGLGLKMMVAATLFTTLVYFLLLPVSGFFRRKSQWALLCFLIFAGFMVSAHFNARFTKDHPKPTSLLYVLDADNQTAQWATYERHVSPWTAQYLGARGKVPPATTDNILTSKYGTPFSYVADAPLKEIPPPVISTIADSVAGDQRTLHLKVTHRRKVNRLEVFTNDIPFRKVSINRISLSQEFLKKRKGGRLVTHYISNNDSTLLSLTFPADSVLELTVYEASNDLLHNPLFTVPPRPENAIPMPFVLNDAVLLTKTLRY